MIKPIFLIGVFFLTTLLSGPVGANPCRGPDDCSEYLAKFVQGTSEEDVDRVANGHGLWVLDKFEDSGIYHLIGDPSQSFKQILKDLNADPKVVYAEPNHEIQAENVPNDPLFPELWALHNTGQNLGVLGADLGMEDVWDSLTESPLITVAVIDSGIDFDHEDLSPNMWVNSRERPSNGIDDDGNGFVDDVHGYDFHNESGNPMDDYFHGTHVAGTIGAVGNNGLGVAGITWNVRLMALKFMGPDGRGSLSDAIRAIQYAVRNGAKILNNSWTFTYPGLSGLPSNPALEPVQSLRDAIRKADEAGAIFVAAAGNSGSNNDSIPNYPTSYSVKNIISVAATNSKDLLPNFSNYGPTTVDLGAPGSVIFSTFPTWKTSPPYHHLSGTSMASPHVAGAAALLWAADPGLTHRQVIDRILQGATPLAGLAGKTVTGGRLDVAESFALGFPGVNHPPVANAGPDQLRKLGDVVLLQGRATDQDGDSPLSYRWTLVAPAGSRAVLASPLKATASFQADIKGVYVATAVVSDGKSFSVPDSAKVYIFVPTTASASISPTASPTDTTAASTTGLVVADIKAVSAGADLEPEQGGKVEIGESIALNASQSLLPEDGGEPGYRWTFIEKPAGSESLLRDPDRAESSFTPDLEGRYTVQLSIDAGKSASQAEMSFEAKLQSAEPEKEPEKESEKNPVYEPSFDANGVAASGCSLRRFSASAP